MDPSELVIWLVFWAGTEAGQEWVFRPLCSIEAGAHAE